MNIFSWESCADMPYVLSGEIINGLFFFNLLDKNSRKFLFLVYTPTTIQSQILILKQYMKYEILAYKNNIT